MKDNDTIASRQFRDTDGRFLEIRISRPQPADNGDCSCRWTILDNSDTIIDTHEMYGTDSMQALLGVLMVIGERVAIEFRSHNWAEPQWTGLFRVAANGDGEYYLDEQAPPATDLTV